MRDTKQFISYLLTALSYLLFIKRVTNTLASSRDYACWFALFRLDFLSSLCSELFILLPFVMHWFLLVFLSGSYCVYIIDTCFCIVFFEFLCHKFYFFAVLYIHKVSPLKCVRELVFIQLIKDINLFWGVLRIKSKCIVFWH